MTFRCNIVRKLTFCVEQCRKCNMMLFFQDFLTFSLRFLNIQMENVQHCNFNVSLVSKHTHITEVAQKPGANAHSWREGTERVH